MALRLLVLLLALGACASPSSASHWSITSTIPECITDTQAYLSYLETGQPSSLDLTYGPEREYVQNLTGDTRRIELTQLSTDHVQGCERQAHLVQARQKAQQNTEEERAQCAQVKGVWSEPGNCVVSYRSPRWGSVGGYDVRFDGDGDITGDRDGCPDEDWHSDTRICTS
jgi:hypothetical protein